MTMSMPDRFVVHMALVLILSMVITAIIILAMYAAAGG
jgi:hypothetical protein